jgi:predicted secreted protein
MASNAEWSFGDYVEMGDAGTPTEVFDRIPEMAVINPNFGTLDKVDVTTHDSTAPFRDKITTFMGDAKITLQGNFLPNNAIQLRVENARNAGVKRNFRYVVDASDGQVIYAGQAFVSAFNSTSDVQDARRLTIELEVTGAWPRVAGS